MIIDFRNNTNLQQKSPVFLIMGILLVVLGILAIAYAKWATVFTIELLGVFLILGGIVHLVNAFQGRGWKGISLSTLLGVLYFVMGVICIYKPLEAASGITLLLGAFFFIGGLYRFSWTQTDRLCSEAHLQQRAAYARRNTVSCDLSKQEKTSSEKVSSRRSWALAD